MHLFSKLKILIHFVSLEFYGYCGCHQKIQKKKKMEKYTYLYILRGSKIIKTLFKIM